MRPHHSSSMHLGGYPPPPQLGPRHGSMPYEGSSNGYPAPSSSRHPSGSNSYYYSSNARPPPPLNPIGNNSAAPSPGGHSYRTNPSIEHYPPPQNTATMLGRRTNSLGPLPHAEPDPSYHVEHLATFAVGRQFGLQSAQDGIRKLKHMEKQSAIWAQPLILKLLRDKISVEDENGDIVEQFQMRLIENPIAHQSQDRSDTYNNILLFIVRSDDRNPPGTPTEMHIFHCIGISAKDVAQDIHYYTRGQHQKVRGGRRDVVGHTPSIEQSNYGPVPQNYYRDDASPSSNSSEAIDMNVNTLNRCFDDIERFVARIQSAAIAQRELDMQRLRTRPKQRGKEFQPPAGILQLRAQMPTQGEFFDIFQKFKLSFNILTMVKDFIHDPNAPELLHFLFTPLIVILDACHWGLNQQVAPQVVSPLLSFDAIELLRNCLTSKEFDIWMSLGQNWRTPPEEFRGQLPPPYRPVFRDNVAPYGYPQGAELPPQPHNHSMHRGSSAPPPQHHQSSRQPQRAVDDLELERVNLEKERIAFERMKLLERERYLEEQEQRMMREQSRLEAERDLLKQEAMKQRVSDNVYVGTSPSPVPNGNRTETNNLNPQMWSFLRDLLKHNRKIVEVTYDRVKQHDKELTVMRGEYLEVLSDEKNWWECRNYQNAVGFVPHTILSGPVDPSQIPQLNPSAHVTNTGVQTNIHYVEERAPIPVAPPLPPESFKSMAPSTPFLDEIKNKILNSKTDNGTTTSSKIEAHIRARRKEELPYIADLFDTINGKRVVLPRRQPSNKGHMITHKSAIPEVQQWLKEKRFTPRVLTLFSNFNGSDLFMLSKSELEQHCGDEGKRLYSLLLVQKRRSNYDSFSKSDPALRAILNMRRVQVEKQNEAAAEPEEDPPAPDHPVEIKTYNRQAAPMASGALKPLVPPSQVIKTVPLRPPSKRANTKPEVAPRTTTAQAYQPSRLASPPEQNVNKGKWLQTIKSYN